MALSPEFLAEKDKKETQPTDLYEIEIPGQPTIYLANSRANISYNGHPYIACAIKRSAIVKTADGKANKVSLTLDNVSRAFTSIVQNYRITGLKCTIKQIFRDLPGHHRLVFVGYLASPLLDGKNFAVDVKQHVYTLQIKLPRRVYQRWCNCKFGNAECLTYKGIADSGTTTRLNDDALISGHGSGFFQEGTLTITSGTNAGQVRTVANSDTGYVEWFTAMPLPVDSTSLYTLTWKPPTMPGITDSGCTMSILYDNAIIQGVNFWKHGLLSITTGLNAGQKRKIIESGVGWVKVALVFPYTIETGVAYSLSAGCDKTAGWCIDHFGNGPNFSGFLHISTVQNLRRYRN